MKVLITGVNGLLGKDIGELFSRTENFEVYGIGRAECLNKNIYYRKVDLNDFQETKDVLKEIGPDIIVHCAAYTKLDDCERERDYAWHLNVELTKLLANETGKLVYISSDAVFSGEKGDYKEEDEPDAINYYGYTKYQGEKAALQNKKALIIRSSIYGFNTNDNQSIVEWGIQNLSKNKPINGFMDVKFNPLYSVQLAQIILELLKRDCQGVCHLGSKETISKYSFFRLLAKELEVAEDLVKPVSVESIKFFARRTKDTSLNIAKMADVIDKYNDLGKGIKHLLEDMRKYKRM